jgi:hypothetical protein
MTASSSSATPAGPDVPGYPAARRADLVEDLHGQRVPDPYRWLEDAASAETQEWLQAQDRLWASAEEGLPGRSRFAAPRSGAGRGSSSCAACPGRSTGCC